MQIRRPVFGELPAAVSIAVVTDAGDIVGEGVQPYVDHMLRVKVHGNAPAEGGPGHAEILEARQQEVVHHLIFPGNRLNELRMLIDILDQFRSVFAHAEEVGLLPGRGHRPAAVRTLAVHQLGFRKERFTGGAVHPLVIAFINIPLVVELFEDLLYLLLVGGIRGADEFIIGSLHEIPDAADLSGHLIYQLLGGDALLLGLQFDLLAVLVGTGLKKHIIALLPVKTGNAVRQHCLVGIADVGLSGGIGDGCGNIIFLSDLFHLSISLLSCYPKAERSRFPYHSIDRRF